MGISEKTIDVCAWLEGGGVTT